MYFYLGWGERSVWYLAWFQEVWTVEANDDELWGVSVDDSSLWGLESNDSSAWSKQSNSVNGWVLDANHCGALKVMTRHPGMNCLTLVLHGRYRVIRLRCGLRDQMNLMCLMFKQMMVQFGQNKQTTIKVGLLNK